MPLYRPPSLFIEDEIRQHEWNNIPIPMVEAVETMKVALHNLESLFVLLAKENKNRSIHIARKVQAMEKATAEREEAVRR